MRTSNILKAFCGAVLIFGIQGCDNFLDKQPSKNTSLVVKTTDDLDALLGNPSNFYTLNDYAASFATDDVGLTPEIYNARPGNFNGLFAYAACWDTEYLPLEYDYMWSAEYKKIFIANMVLGNLGNVTGPAEAKEQLKAEAHMMRAYSLHKLAQIFCLPYTGNNGEELGLSLKQTTSFEELTARGSLAATYEMIESDIEEAFKITTPLVRGGKARNWRGTTAGINAFAARYWLERGNYQKSLGYAQAALDEYSELVDYNDPEQMYYSSIVNEYTITDKDGNTSKVKLDFPYTHDNQSDLIYMIGWKEFYLFRVAAFRSWWFLPSKELLDLYGPNKYSDGNPAVLYAHEDLRYKYHMVEGYSYDRSMTNPAYDYPGYVFFYKDRIPEGPTVAEMILTKAECQMRLDNFQDGMNTLNTLRAKRIDKNAVHLMVNLTAANKEEALKHLREERRREMPFSRRWFDLRRYNNNEDANDDVTLTREFYPFNAVGIDANAPVKTYTLDKNSRRWAWPLPETELTSSDGKIVQNTY